ncbi:MAG: hypothetical protein AB1499_06850 [Nitrospirota bacterium]
MVGKLVASALAGSTLGRAIGPILKSADDAGSAEAGSEASKGILQNIVDWLSGEDAGAGAGTGLTPALSTTSAGTVPLYTLPAPLFSAPAVNVGGVLFDRSAEVVTDLEEITGAYWDDKLGQLILVGTKNGRQKELHMPRMDKDHFAVAVRAVFSGDNLGVSIDPPPGYIESGKFPDDGTEMEVRYLGNTKDTLFGAIMFEADRLLKTLSMGKDNITRKEVTSGVRGYQNEIDLSFTLGTENKSAWHRMWFVIEDVKLDLPIKESPDRNSIKFGKAAIKVKAEYISKEKNPGADPVAAKFAEHFTVNYDEFAREFPVLERLRELAKISAVVKWLKNSGKPVDLSFLKTHEFIKVPTPDTTPGITASKSKSETRHEGTVIHTSTRTFSLYGGVDFDFRYESVADNGEVLALKNVAQERKPHEAAVAWDFNFEGVQKRAVAFSAGMTNGDYRTSQSDFSFTYGDALKLELVRDYDSRSKGPSVFGRGWNLKVPSEIFIVNTEKTDSPILLIDRTVNKTSKYLFIEDRKAYFLVSGEKESSFSYNPKEFITRLSDGGFSWKDKNGFDHQFDPQGRLISLTDRGGRELAFTYEQNRMVKIAASNGTNISLLFDQKDRVRKAVCMDRDNIEYGYNASGELVSVTRNGVNVISYVYDADHRLIKAMDRSGRVISRSSYDSVGRVIKKHSDTFRDEKGNIIVRRYDDNYRLIREEDKMGNVVSYDYDKESNLLKSIITDRKKRAVILNYDMRERITRITDPLDNSMDIAYDDAGNISSFTDANRNRTQFGYDTNGNLILVRDANGNQWRREYDESSRLISMTDPSGRSARLSYQGDRLACIETPAGTTRYEYDAKGDIIKMVDPNGNCTEYIYDSGRKLVGVKNALGVVTHYDPSAVNSHVPGGG